MNMRLNSLTSLFCRTLPVLAGLFFAALPAGISVSLAAGKVVTPAKKPATPPEPPTVIRYEGNQKEKYSGKEAVVVYGVDLLSGQEMKLMVPPADAKAKSYTPKPEIMDIVDQLKPGGYAKLEMHSQYNEHWLNRIEFYKMAAGEELPGNFVFYESYEKKDDEPHVQIVTLQKFGQAVDAIVPMKPGPDKKTAVIDPGMLATVNALQKGQVVAVDVISGNPPVIKSIDLYKPPTEAKMGKVVEADVAENLKGPAIEVDEDGKTVTLPIRGQVQGKKWMPDNLLLSHAKSLKPGTAVLVTTHDEAGKTFLRDIKAAPVQPAAAAGTKTGTGRFDK